MLKMLKNNLRFLVRFFGMVWVIWCLAFVPLIFALGWSGICTGEDLLLLTFNGQGEKAIELWIVAAGVICSALVLPQLFCGVFGEYQKRYKPRD